MAGLRASAPSRPAPPSRRPALYGDLFTLQFSVSKSCLYGEANGVNGKFVFDTRCQSAFSLHTHYLLPGSVASTPAAVL